MRREVLLEISGVVLGSTDSHGSAQEVLDLLSELVPYAAASLQAWDPLAGCHRTLAHVGYEERAIEHLDTWFVQHDEAFLHMRDVDARPVRWQDMPFEYRDGISAQNFWLPAGYREGVTTRLMTRSGRYTGNLHLNTASSRHPSDDSMLALQDLQLILSGITDLLHVPGLLVDALGSGVHAVLLRTSDGLVNVPGRNAGPWLTADSPLIHALRQATGTEDLLRCLWVDEQGTAHRVNRVRLPHGFLVTEAQAEIPYALTARELEVLSLLGAGRTNTAIAEQLTVTARTAAKHVEHVLRKLGCTSRTQAAILAIEEGLLALDTTTALR